MKKELPHFFINSSYGGNQLWFKGFSMRLGGCAAETACDISIYLDLYKKMHLYPFDINNLSKTDYAKFATVMKPFLRPRMGGIDKLSVFADGFGEYVKSVNGAIRFSFVDENDDYETAKKALIRQIDSENPVAFLCLMHKDKRFSDYKWHWFLINAYEVINEKVNVKAVTYGSFEWLDFEALWNTGYSNRGGMVLIEPDLKV